MDSFKHQMEEYSFPLYEPSKITLQKKLGSGGTGTVYLGTLNLGTLNLGTIHTKECVVKKVSSNNYDEHHKYRMLYQDIIDEVYIGHRFIGTSKHLIQFYGYSIFKEGDNTIIYLIMEKTNAPYDVSIYLGSVDLWKGLTKQEYKDCQSKTKMYHESGNKIIYWDYILSDKDKFNLMKQMCIALQELHKNKIVHCDLKTNNMLYTDSIIKLIDFGASQYMGKSKEINGPSGLGTPGYMAQEMYGGWISYQSDIYSLGVCMLEIWYGDIWPTNTDDLKKCRRYVLDYLILLKKENPTLHSLIQRCVSTDSKKRPLIKTVLSNLDRIQASV